MEKKDIPKPVIDAASELIKLYGNHLEYLGRYKGQEAFCYGIPNAETGFPFVYLYNGEIVKEITHFDALEIINLLVED